MASVWIKLPLFLACVINVSQKVEGKKFHRTSSSIHHFRSPSLNARHQILRYGRRPGLTKGNIVEVNEKEPHAFVKKSVAPFHIKGTPLVHLSFESPKQRLHEDNAPTAQPERGSFKIDDSGVIGGGTYEIDKDGVDVDINLKIAKNPTSTGTATPKPQPGTSSPSSTPKLCPMPCPQPVQPTAATPTPAKPKGSQNKPASVVQTSTTPSPVGLASPKPGKPTTPVEIGGSPHEAPTPVPGTEAATASIPGVTQPISAPGGGGGSDFETEGLNEHNKFRKVHGVLPLTLNAEMSQEAAAYAQKIARMGTLQHASKEERKGYGENLSMGCSSNKGGQTATEAVTNWYNEVCSPGYNFGSDSGGSGTGHFTQIVWKESKELGMGKAESEKDGMKCTYIVGRYNPAGNMMGAYADNVPKGSFDQSYCSKIQQKRSDGFRNPKNLDANSWR